MKRLFLAFLLLSPGLALTQTPPPAPATVADVLAGTATYKFISPAAAAGAGLSSPTNGVTATAVTNIVNLMAPALGVSNAVITLFTQSNSAWVSKSGSDTTGTVGKRELPFLTVSNAVRSLKLSLAGTDIPSAVMVGPGLFSDDLINLQRTNLTGISLIGEGVATVLTSISTSYLTNHGPLVVVGHSSRVQNMMISNDVSYMAYQAAVGYDAGRAGYGFNVPTNVVLKDLVLRGNTDCIYLYSTSGNVPTITIDNVDAQSKWDALFLNTGSASAFTRVRNSSIKVFQPDNYDWTPAVNWQGAARAVYIGDGDLLLENSIIQTIGGNHSTGTVVAVSFQSITSAVTNIGSLVSVATTGPNPTTLKDYDYANDAPVFLGRMYPSLLATNSPSNGLVLTATSDATTKWATASGGGDVTQSGQNNFSGSNYFGGLTRFYAPVGMSNVTIFNNSIWSVNGLTWNFSSGKEVFNYGNVGVTNDPNTTLAWWDLGGARKLLDIEPDAVAGDPHVYIYNPRGDGAGISNLVYGPVPIASTGVTIVTNTIAGTGQKTYTFSAGAGSITLTNTTSAAGLVVGGSGSFGIGTNLSSVAGGTNQFWIAASPPNEKYTNLFGNIDEISGAYRVLTVGTNVGNNVQISDGISSFPNGMWIDAGAQEYFVGKISVGTSRGQFQLGSGAVSNLTATGVIYAPSNNITGGISAGSLTATNYNFLTNGNNIGTIMVGQVLYTNITGNVTLGGFSGVTAGYNQWAKVIATNSTATDYKITLAASVMTSTNAFVVGQDVWVTNKSKVHIVFDIGPDTNAAAVRFQR